MVSLLAGALLGGPGSDDGSDAGVEGNIGDRRLGAEKSSASAEVGVERRETLGSLSSVLGRRCNVGRGDKPLLNLGLLVGRVLVEPMSDLSPIVAITSYIPQPWGRATATA